MRRASPSTDNWFISNKQKWFLWCLGNKRWRNCLIEGSTIISAASIWDLKFSSHDRSHAFGNRNIFRVSAEWRIVSMASRRTAYFWSQSIHVDSKSSASLYDWKLQRRGNNSAGQNHNSKRAITSEGSRDACLSFQRKRSFNHRHKSQSCYGFRHLDFGFSKSRRSFYLAD